MTRAAPGSAGCPPRAGTGPATAPALASVLVAARHPGGRSRRGEPLRATPTHRDVAEYLRRHALGIENAVPRGAVRTYVLDQAKQRGETWHHQYVDRPEDFDRILRAIAKQCLELFHWPVLSTPAGYYYGRPDVARDWRACRHNRIKLIVAHGREIKAMGHAREAEAARLRAAARSREKAGPWPVQMDLFATTAAGA